MSELQIFCDARFGNSAQKLLQEGVAPHRLLVPQQPSASILAVAAADPAMLQADIAFGQPSVESVLSAKRLRWLQLSSAGYTRYDTPEFRAAAAARGLIVTNSSTVYANACAEHVFSFMLAQARQLPGAIQAHCEMASPQWNQLRTASSCLLNQEVVILGFGTIAARLVEMLAPFHMKITAMRRHPKGNEGVPTVTEDNVAAVLSTADHIVNILPDNTDSVGFISAQRLGQMKHGAIFYNIGRGTTVDQNALASSLRSGHLGAAWLDVTDPEPLPKDHPLWTAPRCYITPHLAGGQQNESETLIRHFLKNLRCFTAGSPLHDRIM